MPQKIVNEQGEEIEVFTSEELEAQRQEAIEQYKTENPDKTGDLEELQRERDEANEKIEELNKKLEGELDKDKNFAELRKQKEDAEKKLKDVEGSIDDKIGTAKKEIMEGVMKDHYEQTLSTLAGEDAELKKKIEFEYNRLGDEVTTQNDITKKLRDAWRYATLPEEGDALNTNVVSSGGAAPVKPPSQGPFTEEEKQLGQKLAQAGGILLSEDDFK